MILLVFWVLILLMIGIAGFCIAGLFGDKIYDKIEETKKIYTEEEDEYESE